MTPDLSTATPVEIDTQLAALLTEMGRQEATEKAAIDSLHRTAGDTKQHRNHGPWTMTDDDAIAAGTALAAGDTTPGESWKVRRAKDAIAVLYTARAELARLAGKCRPLDAEYDRRPWSRFFNVSGGHVHSDAHCSTLHRMGKPTPLGWMPALSGLAMADAIKHFESQGSGRSEVLCSVCMPDAPTALHSLPVDDTVCPGTGTRSYDPEDARTRLRSWHGRGAVCTECGQWTAVTQSNVLRKHRKPKA